MRVAPWTETRMLMAVVRVTGAAGVLNGGAGIAVGVAMVTVHAGSSLAT